MSTTRDRMILSTAMLLREHGLSGTSVRDVIEHSGAPRGSIYHHFPGGKAEMVEAAVDWAGDTVTTAIRTMSQRDPGTAIREFVAFWQVVLESSDYRAGCPVVAVAAENGDDPEEDARLAQATARAFTGWSEALSEGLEQAGYESRRAKALATTIVAAIEGAVVLCRAERSSRPLKDVGDELALLLEAAAT